MRPLAALGLVALMSSWTVGCTVADLPALNDGAVSDTRDAGDTASSADTSSADTVTPDTDTSGSADAEAGADVEADGGADVEADGDADEEADGGADADVEADVSADADTDADGGADADEIADAEGDETADADGIADANPEEIIEDTSVTDTTASCGTTVTGYELLASPHETLCSYLPGATSLSTSGPHYPYWAAFQVYDQPVPYGFLIHAMEHGAVVITYRCEASCEADVASLVAFVDALPLDPICPDGVDRRVIVAPDPTLPVRFAARSWGWALVSSCFDLDALAEFVTTHYGMGAETTCGQGLDVFDPDSVPYVPADCGQP